MSHTAKSFLNQDIMLVTLPDVYLRVKAVLDNPRSSAADMAQAIETDPATSARLLRMANSPFFGFAAEVDRVGRAVSMLGTVQVHDLVLASALASSFADITTEALDVAAFWRESLKRGIGAKLIANHCNVLDADRLFVAGLLSNIGNMLFVMQAPDLAERAYLSARNRRLPLAAVQRELCGFDYGELGAELLALWRLPASLEEIVRFQARPADAPNYPLETAILHCTAGLDQDAEFTDSDALTLAQLSPASLADIAAEVRRDLDAVVGLLAPLKKSA